MKPAIATVLALLLLGLGLTHQNAAADETFLDPEQAFVPSLSIDGNTVTISWQIATGYFLYRHGFDLEARVADQDAVQHLDFELPEGTIKYDPFFERKVQTYKQDTTMDASLAPLEGKALELIVTAQGCADEGLCFAPTPYRFDINSNELLAQLETSQPALNSQTDSLITTGQDLSTLVTDDQPTVTGTADSEAVKHLSIAQWLWLVMLALMGGFILNLMPCVFPVLSLKALSFSRQDTASSALKAQGWAYTLGVVLSFILAASLILIAKSAGQSLGWGFQLQHPVFVSLMIYLFFTMALSLSGAFEFGSSIMGLGQNLTTGQGLRSSFFTGVLAALVASPCTAPFMATASGVALTQSTPIALSIFAALGLGMALPFLALSYSPSLSQWLPKPGAWMLRFKQALAFPLYLTVLWLLWVLSHQTDADTLLKVLLGLLLLVGGLWLYSLSAEKKPMLILRNVATVALVIQALIIASNSNQPASALTERNPSTEVYSAQRLAYHRNQGHAVFVDLTADWCLTCKINESVALTSDVKNQLIEHDIIIMVGDWTNENPEISTLLKQHHRNGIPLYLMYPEGDGEPEMLPQLLTKSIVLAAMEQAVL